ncbi:MULTISPECIES: ATP-binding cassette domain-containing protein [unclassified Gemella]|uniref:ABC transporter ATP-binding protein/permease n=1 Tax=unclassified Gemella TaxID=2624949 RepID=UPI0015CF9CA5|nr:MULTISPECIES: ABC transporter ATP-binding protein/permease [unclassified Gemella]MBF0710779.1 ATP-binding cassette domain-containing protein [Gemella sp. GL1.1]NYS28123.1 ATP-binding cassette domain-containing protein [Gemella sp. GL1]
MLELKNIVKEYNLGGVKSTALKNVSIAFPQSEFVSILGASGSGKTTMLNIIGGIDKYTSGDLVIAGKSSKDFKDKDWDAYRNGTIGFVFQAYNLISHLTVLDNVKLALSISGISSREAIEKSKDALERVGLAEHINKKPGQLSGGQMQRVAIARALVTNPKIILADEPTGALDSKTSVQIMELIKEISKDKLVIMVTHNPELAKEYSDRIVRVADGEIVEDTKPYSLENSEGSTYIASKTAMSLKDAVKSSFNNLLTKKLRTFLTVLASSIGIISIALVLSISEGMNGYISKLEGDNVSTMPFTIMNQQPTEGVRIARTSEDTGESSDANSSKIKASSTNDLHTNKYSEDILGNGQTFIKYFEENAKDYYKNIEYTNAYGLKSLVKNYNNQVQEVKIEDAETFGNSTIFSKLSTDKSVLTSQFDIVAKLDENFDYIKDNEMILFVGKDNSLDKSILRALGYDDNANLEFKDLLGKEISVVDNDNYFEEVSGIYVPKKADDNAYNSGVKAKIVAVAKPSADNVSRTGYSLGYTSALEKTMLDKEKNSKIVAAQKKDTSKNVMTKQDLKDNELENVLGYLGASEKPISIAIYPKSVDDKAKIENVIVDYNKKVENKYPNDASAAEKNSIKYMDISAAITGILGEIITTITIILTSFAAISLVVSSIMIGILTYVSVVERTKEIGILRAIGARKKDITRIFNAEAGLVGLISGLTGVLIAATLSLPLSSVIKNAIKVESFKASLPLDQAIYLIGLSLILTLLASIIPARIAAKKNPVEALRSE